MPRLNKLKLSKNALKTIQKNYHLVNNDTFENFYNNIMNSSDIPNDRKQHFLIESYNNLVKNKQLRDRQEQYSNAVRNAKEQNKRYFDLKHKKSNLKQVLKEQQPTTLRFNFKVYIPDENNTIPNRKNSRFVVNYENEMGSIRCGVCCD